MNNNFFKIIENLRKMQDALYEELNNSNKELENYKAKDDKEKDTINYFKDIIKDINSSKKFSNFDINNILEKFKNIKNN